MRFVIEMTSTSDPAWWLVDDDEHVVAWAGRTFTDLAHADEAAHDFRVNTDDPEYRVHAEAEGRWQWAAWRPDGQVAVSAGSFPSEESARDAARWVRQRAGTAIGP